MSSRKSTCPTPPARSRRTLALLPALLALSASCLPRDATVGDEHSRSKRTQGSTDDAPTKAPAKPKKRSSSTVKEDPLLRSTFTDTFDRPVLGPDWRRTTPKWKLVGGKLCGESARNHPIWLKRRLPVNARIEFDALSHSDHGDIKAEFWGDGRSHAAQATYDDATSYLAIFGGWKNRYHVLARLDEHAESRKELRLTAGSDELRTRRVEKGKTYRHTIERADGRIIRWKVDGHEILSYNDGDPLVGPGHQHMGFNDWEARVCFDNLQITPL